MLYDFFRPKVAKNRPLGGELGHRLGIGAFQDEMFRRMPSERPKKAPKIGLGGANGWSCSKTISISSRDRKSVGNEKIPKALRAQVVLGSEQSRKTASAQKLFSGV